MVDLTFLSSPVTLPERSDRLPLRTSAPNPVTETSTLAPSKDPVVQSPNLETPSGETAVQDSDFFANTGSFIARVASNALLAGPIGAGLTVIGSLIDYAFGKTDPTPSLNPMVPETQRKNSQETIRSLPQPSTEPDLPWYLAHSPSAPGIANQPPARSQKTEPPPTDNLAQGGHSGNGPYLWYISALANFADPNPVKPAGTLGDKTPTPDRLATSPPPGKTTLQAIQESDPLKTPVVSPLSPSLLASQTRLPVTQIDSRPDSEPEPSLPPVHRPDFARDFAAAFAQGLDRYEAMQSNSGQTNSGTRQPSLAQSRLQPAPFPAIRSQTQSLEITSPGDDHF